MAIPIIIYKVCLILFLSNILQDEQQVVPYHLNSRNEKALVGCVNETKGGAEANQIKIRVALREKTSLQTCVDAANDGLLTEELLVSVNGDLLQF